MSLLNKIKALFEAEVIESTFKDSKTKDGVILRIDGDKVSIIAEDGTVTPAPAADYILEDDSVISVDETGTIIKAAKEEVKPEEEVKEEEKLAEDAPVAETPVEEKGEEDAMTVLEAKVSELEAAIQMIAEQMKTMMDNGNPAQAEMNDIKKENKSLKKQNKELAAEPAAPAVAFKKVDAIELANAKKGTRKSSVNEGLMNKIIALK